MKIKKVLTYMDKYGIINTEKMKGMMKLKLTNDIITNDALSVLRGDYIIAGVFSFAIILIFGVLIYFLIKGFRNKTFFKQEIGNTISLVAFFLVGILVTSSFISGEIMPLKEQIADQKWRVEEDYCLSKRSGAIPNVEDYQIGFERMGTKRVSREVYNDTDEGAKHYIVRLSNGDELIYSSQKYDY